MFPPFIIPSISSDTTKTLVKTGIGIGLFLYGRHLYNDWKKSQGEEQINTPEGQIAQQLKNIFDSTPADDAAYRRVMQQVNTGNEEKVRDIYKLLTGRFLTDDEAKHISASTQESAAHQYKINNTPGTLISIDNDEIKFNVGRGSLVRFAPGQTKPISLYLNAEDIATGATPAASMPPNSKYWKVTDTKLVPLEGIKLRKDWKIIFTPILPLFAVTRTSKEFAAVQIDISGGKGQTLAWANATDFRTQKNLVSGIEEIPSNNFVVAVQPTEILNQQFKVTGIAPKGVIIGSPQMILNTNKQKFIQVKTIQGLIRWVKMSAVKVRELNKK